ncbi:MAG: glycoside hydrolase family 36 protein [Ignavibacteriaceae bacterium]
MISKLLSFFLYSLLLILLSCSNSNSPFVKVENKYLQIEFDDSLYSKVISTMGDHEVVLSDYSASEYPITDGKEISKFYLKDSKSNQVENELGKGEEFVITGLSKNNIQKQISVSIYENFPSSAFFKVTYKNVGANQVTVNKWVNNAYNIKTEEKESPPFWSYQGATYDDRRDWVKPIKLGFEQENYMGMNASDYGGGTPVVDVWGKSAGIAVGLVETTPKLVKLPVKMKSEKTGAEISIEYEKEQILKPGESFETYESFVNVHKGDYYATLKNFRKIMSKKGLEMQKFPETSYQPIWCAWGYERDFKVKDVLGTLPEVKKLGFKWAVLDDGWQTSEGDWYLNPKKFPGGDSSMKAFVDKIHAAGLKAKLWWAPLAVDPGTDLIKKHPDMLLLNKDGSKRDISWWDSYYLCPAYDETLSYTKNLVTKIFNVWGYDGIKIDGQHLNAVPPCYNPKHNHAYPEESVEKLQDFWKMVYETAVSIKKDAVVEICPCGTNYSFYNLPYMNQPVASDPESSWQIRLKGKTLKGLMGESLPYYGDHVELSSNKSDFASTVGIGGVIGTKFVWPVGIHINKETGDIGLTGEKEKEWAKWVKIYDDKMLSKGIYLGELYDIGFDKPETHAISKNGKMFYAFYAPEWDGKVELRGLENKTYKVKDYVNNTELGEVTGPLSSLPVKFEHSLLIECAPVN